MKRQTLLLLALLLSGLFPVGCLDAPESKSGGTSSSGSATNSESWPEEPTWISVWQDEFDGSMLDTTKWSFDLGGNGWGNQELQYYTDRQENARVDGEHLIIEAKKEDYSGNGYTSARLNSKETWTYGRYEIRAKLPSGRGTWPALWMLAENDVYGDAYWPDNGEIDIMEHVGYDEGVIHATVHTEAYNHIQGTQRGKSKTVSDATSAFHVYSIEWAPDEVRAYIDGTQYFSFANERLSNPSAGYAEWPFDQPFFLLMNIAVGGTWGGAQGVDDSIFPQRMEVDYVRVYQPESIVNP
ncbi:glycoside hydrolase [Longibacter salinarum]|uniref:Glycoside hydrolase n=1 Tax=Longibacter salinarum TaxID=1850348 RepID=A0A2A8CVY9_9BACT|nr:glycoside hydrolase family 16 protein [Longibacter salinarum]PEN12770.1 glycoside hydrolase [Longibacter salinarum]